MNGERKVFPLNERNGPFLRKKGKMSPEKSLFIAVFEVILMPISHRRAGAAPAGFGGGNKMRGIIRPRTMQ